MSETKPKGTLRLYSAGGCGINIAKRLEEFRSHAEVGSANLAPVYIDTSRSNLEGLAESAAEHVYLLEGLDGSGKIRRENHGPIKENTRKILKQFPPADVNVVISSGSGGSGSVIAPSLVAELLANDQQVVVIVIGSTESGVEIQNTLNTLKSYESISQLHEHPVVASYFQNSKDTPRDKVDEAAANVILSLSVVFSRENTELDTRDLYNFLNYQRVTSYPVKLVGLSLWTSNQVEQADDIVSVALVVDDINDADLPFTPEYKTVGYISANASEDLKSMVPLVLVTQANVFNGVARDLSSRLEELEKAKKARIQQKSFLNAADDTTDDGLVL